MNTEQRRAYDALAFITPLLQKRGLRSVITGGFAAYVYGVPRALTDIDIDIEGSKDDEAFQLFSAELESHVTQELEHFVDQNYDNYNFEITYKGQIVDVCSMQEMNIFNKETQQYENFYKEGFPKTETVDFLGYSSHCSQRNLSSRTRRC